MQSLQNRTCKCQINGVLVVTLTGTCVTFFYASSTRDLCVPNAGVLHQKPSLDHDFKPFIARGIRPFKSMSING